MVMIIIIVMLIFNQLNFNLVFVFLAIKVTLITQISQKIEVKNLSRFIIMQNHYVKVIWLSIQGQKTNYLIILAIYIIVIDFILAE